MKGINLGEVSNIELELLMVKESKLLKNFDRLWDKIEAICKEEMDLTHQEALDFHDYALTRMEVLEQEYQMRKTEADISAFESRTFEGD